MIDIAKKKLPQPVIYVLVYLSYCAMSWFISRGTIAYYSEQNNLPGWFANDIWAFFIGGLVPFALYAFFSWFVVRMLAVRVGNGVQSLGYGLHYAVISANLVLFGLKFMYLALPLQAVAIDAILTPAVTLAVVALYMWYAFYMNYIDKALYRIAVTQIFGSFATVYAVIVCINLVMSLTAV